MFSRTADHVRQHAAQELFAAVAAAQDDERAEVFRRLCNEVGHALDSVLVGLHRLGAPRNSSVEIPAMQDPIDELSDVIVKRFAEPVEWRSSYAAPADQVGRIRGSARSRHGSKRYRMRRSRVP